MDTKVDTKELMLADAIYCAIDAEKRCLLQRKMLIALSISNIVTASGLIYLLMR